MKSKYMINWGWAFAEKYEMKKLEKKASEGWHLQDFAFLGYKLVEGPKQELTYTLDIQSNPDKGYFDIFRSAGWRHIKSSCNHYHIFTAPKGTPPIYSGNEIEEGKYENTTTMLGKGAVYSLLALIIFYLTMIMSKSYFEFMTYPLLFMFLICSVIFIFCFLPYLAFKIKKSMNY